jgi:hypothetical protein
MPTRLRAATRSPAADAGVPSGGLGRILSALRRAMPTFCVVCARPVKDEPSATSTQARPKTSARWLSMPTSSATAASPLARPSSCPRRSCRQGRRRSTRAARRADLRSHPGEGAAAPEPRDTLGHAARWARQAVTSSIPWVEAFIQRSNGEKRCVLRRAWRIHAPRHTFPDHLLRETPQVKFVGTDLTCWSDMFARSTCSLQPGRRHHPC